MGGIAGELPDDRQRLVEVAVDRHDPGARDQRLEKLAERDLAGRKHHHDFEPSRRSVCSRRGRRVAGRRANKGVGALLEGLRDGHDHAPVLEAAGRVLALDLEVEVRKPELAPQASSVEQRRETFAKRQSRRRVGDRQEPSVVLDKQGASRSRRVCHTLVGHRLTPETAAGACSSAG